MQILRILFLNLMLSMYVATPLSAQIPNMRIPLTTEVAKVIKSKEPGWKYITGVCHCPRITSGEVVLDIGKWERKIKGGRLETIRMRIHKIASTEEAAQWMDQWNREIAIGWPQVKRYDLADEAYLLDHRFGVNSVNPITIFFRKKNIIVEVSGDSLGVVERFARYSVKALPVN
ncbi:MAG TPA: hypothetical protein VKB86_19795 [Pyrinomonadaceae bacterium]|nr:hypothetical protein [Pyrinomonadaceae bacterium]